MLHFVFDPDGDTDPDTDACDKDNHRGSSTFLILSARHVANGEPAQNRDLLPMKALRAVPPIPEGFQRIARGREAHPGFRWEKKTTPEGLKPP
jgi:hypothetical protein